MPRKRSQKGNGKLKKKKREKQQIALLISIICKKKGKNSRLRSRGQWQRGNCRKKTLRSLYRNRPENTIQSIRGEEGGKVSESRNVN